MCVCVSLCVLLFVNVQRSVCSTPLFCVYEGFTGKVAYVFALKKTNTVCVFLPRVHKHTNLTCTHTQTHKNLSQREMTTVSHRDSIADRACSGDCCKHTVVDLNPPILPVSYPVSARVTSTRWLTAAIAMGIPLSAQKLAEAADIYSQQIQKKERK